MSEITFTDSNFEQEVLRSDKPVVVDFWAEWCMPCRIVSPIIEGLAKDYAGKVKVGKLNVDENKTAEGFGIMSIPTILVFKSGQIVDTLVGARSKEDYKQAIEKSLAS